MTNDEMSKEVIRILVRGLRENGFTQEQTNAVVEAASMILITLHASGAPLTNTYFIFGLNAASEILRLRKEMGQPPTPPTSSSVM